MRQDCPMRIYFMGIGGTGMGNIAVLLSTQGHHVMGADGPLYPPMSTVLKSAEIDAYEGYNVDRLQELTPDLVVVGNVISRGNPEIEWLLNTRKVPYVSLAELINKEILNKRFNIVITGTHGKTTTTTLAASLLQRNNIDCGYFIGGVPQDLPSGAHLGNPDAPFVIEGDEYDTAFFDKRSKFIHYQPSILVINNIELDHTDIFHNLEDIKRSFSHATKLVPQKGAVLVNGDDPNLATLPSAHWTSCYTVGTQPSHDLFIQNFKENADGASFNLVWKGTLWATLTTPLTGLFNARNAAMASLASALAIHPEDPTQLDLSYLNKAQGAKRRQEIIHESENLILLEDFAHHPSAIEATLLSLKNRYPEHHLIACFEPRSNTARSHIFQEAFTHAFKTANTTLLGSVYKKSLLKPEQCLNTNAMTETLKNAQAFSTNSDLFNHLKDHLKSINKTPTLVIFFSNGSFDGELEKLKREVKTEVYV